jgi:hypothetical protein
LMNETLLVFDFVDVAAAAMSRVRPVAIAGVEADGAGRHIILALFETYDCAPSSVDQALWYIDVGGQDDRHAALEDKLADILVSRVFLQGAGLQQTVHHRQCLLNDAASIEVLPEDLNLRKGGRAAMNALRTDTTACGTTVSGLTARRHTAGASTSPLRRAPPGRPLGGAAALDPILQVYGTSATENQREARRLRTAAVPPNDPMSIHIDSRPVGNVFHSRGPRAESHDSCRQFALSGRDCCFFSGLGAAALNVQVSQRTNDVLIRM